MDPIWSYFFPKPLAKEEKILHLLEQTALFEEMPRKKLKKIMRLLHVRSYEADEVVFSIGEPGVGMYIILEGEVVVLAEAPSGETQAVARLSTGQTFGDLALIEDHLRSATIRTTQSTQLLGLIRPELTDLFKRDPALGCDLLYRLLKVLGARPAATNQLLAETRKELLRLHETTSSHAELEALVAGGKPYHGGPFQSGPFDEKKGGT